MSSRAASSGPIATRDRVEARLDKMAFRSELLELKTRVDDLQGQVRKLETPLDG
jgi:polyhydroxyalkanoate synthesis regulator phasin